MARQRFIHPDIWTDPTFGKLTPEGRLFFIGCFSNADDEGRLLGNPAYLRSAIFPYDDFTAERVREIRDEVVATCKNLVLYVVDGTEYLAFRKWSRYQKPKYPKPSKLPAPPPEEGRLEAPEAAPPPAASQPKCAGTGRGLEDCLKAEEVPAAGASAVGSCAAAAAGAGAAPGREGGAAGFREALLQDGGNAGETFPQDWGNVGGRLEKAFPTGSGRVGMGSGLDGDGLGGEGGPAPGPGPSRPDDRTGRAREPTAGGLGATAREEQVLRELEAVPGYPFDREIDLAHIRSLAGDFPGLDLLAEVKRWRAYKLDKPLSKSSKPRLQLRRWCEIAARERGEVGRGKGGAGHPEPHAGPGAAPSKYPMLRVINGREFFG